MGREWINIKEYGQLYLDKVLVTFDYPILFVCEDFEKKKYLCLNVDSENNKYVICEVDKNQLIGMLNNKLTMETVFRECVNRRIVVAEYDFENETIKSHSEDARNISGDLLPKRGAYFELSNKNIEILKNLL